MTGGVALLAIIVWVTANDSFGGNTRIPHFRFPETIPFEPQLSAYQLFEGIPSDLIPNSDFHLMELSSVLFTDYAHKQRLIKVPAGTSMKRLSDGTVDFPDGTILAKTFFYQQDERAPHLGKHLLETRLEIKAQGKWNIATYVWNQAQTDASLALDGSNRQVSWINAEGISQSTRYHIPSQNECIACHQSASEIRPIGPSLRNLHRTVTRNGTALNQLTHLQAVGVLATVEVDQVPQIVDYHDPSASLAERGRAYLDINCAHCHNPNGWRKATQRHFDFRYDTPFPQTGISDKTENISRTLLHGRMPLIGTTMLDEEGIRLLTSYFNHL